MRVQRVKRKERQENNSIWDWVSRKEDNQIRLIENIKRKPNIFILGTGVSLLLILIAFGTFLSINTSNDVPDYMTSDIKDVPLISPSPQTPSTHQIEENILQDLTITNLILKLLTSHPIITLLITLPFAMITYNFLRRLLR